MQARASLCEEPPHRGVVGQRPEQLDMRVADTDQGSFDTLLGDHLTMLDGQAEPLRIKGDRRVEVLDGDADMVHCLEHRQ
jgi:hypothetical protein